MNTHVSSVGQILIRYGTFGVCAVFAISGVFIACGGEDCTSLAICAANPSSHDTPADANTAKREELDAGGSENDNREPSARGPRCAGMGPVCGSGSGDDCCASTLVPGGTFRRSYDGISGDPGFVATVSDFRLDVYEITVGRFRAFVADYPKSLPKSGAGKNPGDPADPGWDSAWNNEMPKTASLLNAALHCDSLEGWTATPGKAETKPMPCMTWYEALAFCIWDGGRLPTEAEWNYAAAGGDEQRVYPWSSPAVSSKIDENDAVYDTNGNARTLSPVGSKPSGRSRWGQADLAGSVWEWTMDWWRSPYGINPCNDCAERSQGVPPVRTLRGGSLFFQEPYLRTAARNSASPTDRKYVFGARCARRP